MFLRGILGAEHEPDIGIQTGQTVRNGLGGTAFGPEYDQGVRGKIRETAVRNGLKGSGHEDGRETGKGEAVGGHVGAGLFGHGREHGQNDYQRQRTGDPYGKMLFLISVSPFQFDPDPLPDMFRS